MNKTEIKQKQFTNDVEQEQILGYWIRRYGITKRDLDTHPCCEDIVLVINIRQHLENKTKFLTKKQASQLGVIWQTVYTRKKRLYPKHYRILEGIVLETELKATQQQLKQAMAKQKIQQARIKANG